MSDRQEFSWLILHADNEQKKKLLQKEKMSIKVQVC